MCQPVPLLPEDIFSDPIIQNTNQTMFIFRLCKFILMANLYRFDTEMSVYFWPANNYVDQRHLVAQNAV